MFNVITATENAAKIIGFTETEQCKLIQMLGTVVMN